MIIFVLYFTAVVLSLEDKCVSIRMMLKFPLTWWETDAVALVVEEAAHLLQGALPLHHVVHHRALQGNGVRYCLVDKIIRSVRIK